VPAAGAVVVMLQPDHPSPERPQPQTYVSYVVYRDGGRDIGVPGAQLTFARSRGANSGDHIARMEKVFRAIDSNGDGRITRDEHSNPRFAAAAQRLDTNHDGVLSTTPWNGRLPCGRPRG
jgi:hypothetical protein